MGSTGKTNGNNLRTESGMSQEMYGKSFSELTEEQKSKVTQAVIDFKKKDISGEMSFSDKMTNIERGVSGQYALDMGQSNKALNITVTSKNLGDNEKSILIDVGNTDFVIRKDNAGKVDSGYRVQSRGNKTWGGGVAVRFNTLQAALNWAADHNKDDLYK